MRLRLLWYGIEPLVFSSGYAPLGQQDLRQISWGCRGGLLLAERE
jgi:hypothetical protein